MLGILGEFRASSYNPPFRALMESPIKNLEESHSELAAKPETKTPFLLPALERIPYTVASSSALESPSYL